MAADPATSDYRDGTIVPKRRFSGANLRAVPAAVAGGFLQPAREQEEHMNKPIAAIMMAGALSLGACATDNFDDDTLESAGTGAAVGAAVGAGAGAVIGGLSPIEGALIGAAVGGLAGAVWADRDNDGRADGYYYNGQYYQGQPPAQPVYQPAPTYTPPAGERG